MSNSVFLKPDENGNWGKVGTDAAGSMSEQLVFQSGATAVGNGTPADVSGYATLSVRVSISGTATVTFETSVDGTNYNVITGMTGSVATGSSTSSSSDYRFNIGGVKWFRARISSLTAGAVVDAIGNASTTGVIVQSGAINSYGSSDTNSAGTLLQGVGAYNLLYDGTNWIRQRMATNDGTSANGSASASLMGFNGTTWDRLRSVNTGQLKVSLFSATGVDIVGFGLSQADNNASTIGGVATQTYNFGYNGATWDRVRVGKVYKYIEYLNLANATGTTVWTPASGKKFRLMGVMIGLGATNGLVHLRDGVGGSAFFTARDANAASIHFSFGNGYLSGVADRALEVYNATGSTINVWVHAWGTEE